MLHYLGDFPQAIKKSARQVGAILVYKKGDEFIYLMKDKFKDFTYNEKVNKALGGVKKRICNIKAIYDESYTVGLKRGTPIELYFTCGNGNCKKAILYINMVKEDSTSKQVDIEAVDYLTYWENNEDKPQSLAIARDTSLIDFEKTLFNSMGWKYLFSSGVANPQLTLGYPRSNKLSQTLEEMAIANNATIDFGFHTEYGLRLSFKLTATLSITSNDKGVNPPQGEFEVQVKPFKFGSVVDTLGSENISSFRVEEDQDKYKDVRVNLFFPSHGDVKSLGTINVTIPGSITNYDIGSIDFGSPMIPQYCHFKGSSSITVDSYKLGPTSCSFRVSNSLPNAQSLVIEFFGFEVSESTLKDTDTDSDIKQITNMYIQSPTAYDTRIYKGANCTIEDFGNPLIEVGDTIVFEDKTILVTEQNLKYNGGLKGTTKGVVLNG